MVMTYKRAQQMALRRGFTLTRIRPKGYRVDIVGGTGLKAMIVLTLPEAFEYMHQRSVETIEAVGAA